MNRRGGSLEPSAAAAKAAPSADASRAIAEMAREALRCLAVDKLPPTPAHFSEYYHRIAGSVPEENAALRAVRQGVAAFPRHHQVLLKVVQGLEDALRDGRPADIQRAMQELAGLLGGASQPGFPGQLLKRVLERVAAGCSPAALTELGALLGDQDSLRVVHRLERWVARFAAEEGDGAQPDAEPGESTTRVLRHALGTLLGHLPVWLDDAPALADEGRQLSAALTAPECDAAGLEACLDRVSSYLRKLDAGAENSRAIRAALVSLLQLIMANIEELVLDDRWLRGQLEVLRELFAQPLDLRVLDEVERRLKAVIGKQGELKRALSDAEVRLKDMLAGFIDRLASFSEATDSYHDMLERSAGEIAQAGSLAELSDVVARMVDETRQQQGMAQRSHEELNALRSLVDDANQRIFRLQRELQETSELVRHDPLTGLLNRKGLDEALRREIERTRTLGQALCLALIDVDDFKRINDRCGHLVGDQALQHLAQVISANLRGQDALGRYGGEEFLLILPATPLDDAVNILIRLQRELTRHYFMADRQHILITFSAGVALLCPAETPEAGLDRADQAMYLAKRAGKNRVFAA